MADKKDNKTKEIWNAYSAGEKKKLEKLCNDYKDFLSTCKTERESVEEAVRLAELAGYRSLEDVFAKGDSCRQGQRCMLYA